jgi:hypothetical protein
MTRKKPRKESAKAVLAGVRKEMARPRVAESAQKKALNLPQSVFRTVIRID